MRRVRSKPRRRQSAPTTAAPSPGPLDDGPVTLAMIQALIPLGLRAVEDALQQEVHALAGARYARADGHAGIVRWGTQPGSIFLADQKLPITVPRVRDGMAHREVPLQTYPQLQTPRTHDAGRFRRVLEIPCPVDTNAIRATYRAGLLTVVLPRIEDRRGERRRVTITPL